MKRICIRNAALLLFIILLAGCETPMQEFSSDKGLFSIMTPGTFEKSTYDVNMVPGPVKLHVFIFAEPNIAYQASYVDYPVEIINSHDPNDIIDEVIDGLLIPLEGKLTSEEQISYGTDPGREIHFNAKGGQSLGHMVILLSDRRLYQVGVVGSKDTFSSDAAELFIDSFEIW
jgi:hypothetical protein